MLILEKIHSWVLPNIEVGSNSLLSSLRRSFSSHLTTVYISYRAAGFMSNEQIYLSYKNKVSSSYYSKETWNRVMPDLVSRRKCIRDMSEFSPGGPTHVQTHTFTNTHIYLLNLKQFSKKTDRGSSLPEAGVSQCWVE